MADINMMADINVYYFKCFKTKNKSLKKKKNVLRVLPKINLDIMLLIPIIKYLLIYCAPQTHLILSINTDY